MKEQLTVEHQGIKIIYRETDNKFVFELRNRERSVDSLREAREAIDKPAPKDEPAFARIDAWHRSYRDPYHKVQVTSLVDSHWKECWIMDGKKRSKVRQSSVFPCGPHNDALVGKLIALNTEINQLTRETNDTAEKLKHLNDSTNE